ncbi:MAG: hypothetical protein ACRD28_07665 [Acidobacteriaceae bacterium]
MMVAYLHEAFDERLRLGTPLTNEDVVAAAVPASPIPIIWESGIGIIGGMVTSTIHVLIFMPVFFVMMKERVLKHGTLQQKARMA